MATVKKKNELNTPERIEAALIPDGEQPFSTPSNWEWVTLSSISTVISKGTTPQGGKNAYLSDGVNFLRVENICDDGTISHDNIMHVSKEMHEGFLKRSIFQENDLLISIAGTLGKTCIVRRIDLPLNTNQAVSFSRLKEYINCKYIKLSIDNPEIQKHLLSQTKVTSIPNLTLEIIGNCPIPLAPFTEQQRIVDRIESLFTKLDEAKEKAQAVVDGFEDRKAAILHKAFTGELTKEWRNNHPDKSWSAKPWGDFISKIEAGKNWKAEERPPKDNEFGIVKVSAVTWGSFNEYESKTCMDSSQWNPKTQIREGDFLFSRANTIQLVGNCVIVDQITKRLMLSDKILRFSFDDSVNQYFVLYYTRSRLYRNQVEILASGNQEGMRNISQNNLKRIQFPVPFIKEQNEIVKILDEYLSQEHEANEIAKTIIDQIDIMKKSILARAFRGELGTNDPNDESAIELLKRIL